METLYEHPTNDADNFAGFVVGEKFAEGAQAELHHDEFTWINH